MTTRKTYDVGYVQDSPLVSIHSGPFAGTAFTFMLVDTEEHLDVDYKILYTKCTSESLLDSCIKTIIEEIIQDAVSNSTPKSDLE